MNGYVLEKNISSSIRLTLPSTILHKLALSDRRKDRQTENPVIGAQASTLPKKRPNHEYVWCNYFIQQDLVFSVKLQFK